MNKEIKTLDKIQKEIKISLNVSDMEKYLQNAALRLAGGMQIKGFREGKVPKNVVENSVGTEKLWQEAMNEAVQDFFWKVADEERIDSIGMPKIDVSKFVPGELIEFKATVPVMPNIDLPDYKQIAQKTFAKEKKDVEVLDKEVEASLNWLQNSRSQIDQNSKKETKPELNDEFAKSLGGFKDLKALRESIKEGLQKEKEVHEKDRIRLLVLENILKKVDLKIPEFMIDQEVDKMEEEFSKQVAQMDLSIEKYLEQAKKDIDEVKKGWRRKAEERVSSGILLRVIGEKEGVEVDKEEVEKEANKYLAQFENIQEAQKNIDPERLRTHISGIIRNEKVFQLLEEAEKAK